MYVFLFILLVVMSHDFCLLTETTQNTSLFSCQTIQQISKFSIWRDTVGIPKVLWCAEIQDVGLFSCM